MGLGSFLGNFAAGAANEATNISDQNRVLRQKMISDGFNRLSGLYDKSVEQQTAARSLSNRADAIVANNPGKVDKAFVIQKLMADPTASESDIVRSASPVAQNQPMDASAQTNMALGQPAGGPQSDPRTSGTSMAQPADMPAQGSPQQPDSGGTSLHDILFGATGGPAVTNAVNKQFDSTYGAGARSNLGQSASDILAKENTGKSAFTNQLLANKTGRIITGADYNKLHPDQAPIQADEQIVETVGADGSTNYAPVSKSVTNFNTTNNSNGVASGSDLIQGKDLYPDKPELANTWFRDVGHGRHIAVSNSELGLGRTVTSKKTVAGDTEGYPKGTWADVTTYSDGSKDVELKTSTTEKTPTDLQSSNALLNQQKMAKAAIVSAFGGNMVTTTDGQTIMTGLDPKYANMIGDMTNRALELMDHGLDGIHAGNQAAMEAKSGGLKFGQFGNSSSSTETPKTPAPQTSSTSTVIPQTDPVSPQTVKDAQGYIAANSSTPDAKQKAVEYVKETMKKHGYSDTQIKDAGF